MGYSVIPTNGKVAAVSWKDYQRRQPSQSEIQNWFHDAPGKALGIITGRVSRLAVLDFDDEALFKVFKVLHPHLVDTRIVKTQRGYHLYFHVPENSYIRSQHGKGIDLQFEGCYVIAPPSVVDGYEYKLIQGGKPRCLTSTDYDALSAFMVQLSDKATNRHIKPENRLKGRFRATGSRLRDDGRSQAKRTLTGKDLQAIYRAMAPSEGRNNALFRMACLGRDHGLSEDAVMLALVNTHVVQSGERYETQQKRRSEAIRTIRSAFSKPARLVRHSPSNSANQLTNLIREKLMTLKLTCVIRVLDGLRMCGVQPGATFTKLDVIDYLKGIVGEWSIRRALNAQIQIPLPSEPSNPKNAVAKDTGASTIIKCFLITRKKPSNVTSPIIYVMPSNSDLAELLRVPDSHIIDELVPEDLISARSTRKSLHRCYLRRRPGQYPMRWLANRLGLTKRSLRNYHRDQLEIRRQDLFSTTNIHWNNLSEIPDERPHGGFFLEDEQGKRYPAVLGLAKKLLSQAQKLVLKRRLPNFWFIGEKPPELHVVQTQLHVQTRRRSNAPDPLQMSVPKQQRSMQALQVCGSGRVQSRSRSEQTYQRSPEEVGMAAQQLMQKLKSITNQGENHISLERVTQLIRRHGIQAVGQAVETVQSRVNVRNSIGLLMTIL